MEAVAPSRPGAHGRGPVAPSIVAKQILWLRRDLDTTPMHVLKLVYLCHGWMLGIHGASLINEPVEAWQYGPVVPSLYHRYKGFGGGIIVGEPVAERVVLGSSDAAAVIESIETVYRPCTAFQLSALTHQPGTPWDITRRKSGIGSVIPSELIRKHYRGFLG